MNDAPARYGQRLTDRETAVCGLLTLGHSAKHTGLKLGISHRTVEAHKFRIFKKLGVNNVVELTRVTLLREWMEKRT